MLGARSVWSGPSGAQTASALPTYGRLTEADQGSKLEWGEALNGGAWTDSDAQRSGGFKSFGLFLLWLRVFFSENKTLNCQLSTASKLSPVKPVGDRLHRQQTHANVERTGSFRIRPKNKRLTSHCRRESRAGTPCNSFCFPRAVQIISRSSPMHCLERR